MFFFHGKKRAFFGRIDISDMCDVAFLLVPPLTSKLFQNQKISKMSFFGGRIFKKTAIFFKKLPNPTRYFLLLVMSTTSNFPYIFNREIFDKITRSAVNE